MRFSDSPNVRRRDYSPRKTDFLLVGAGHLLVLLLGFVTFSGKANVPTGGENAVMVRMVNVQPHSAVTQEDMHEDEVQEEIENPAEVEADQVQETVVVEEAEETEDIHETDETDDSQQTEDEEVIEQPQETPEQEDQQEVQQEEPSSSDEYSAVGSQGTAGAGAPGPGTYESRVFNAVRRGYRTSVQPENSYRVVLTVNIDGSTDIEVIRKSGTPAFDRAVENALNNARVPPMPPERNSPAVIRIEFVGPEN